METRSADRPKTRQPNRSSAAGACEACRKLKMRCIWPSSGDDSQDQFIPCERCRRNKRDCVVPPPRPLGRKPGAVGRYQGLEKARRKMQSELKKARVSSDRIPELLDLAQGEEVDFGLLPSSFPDQSESLDPELPQPRTDHPDGNPPITDHLAPTAFSPQISAEHITSPVQSEPVSNPLALLADASGAAQALGSLSESVTTRPELGAGLSHGEGFANSGIGRYLLHRPGYISLGLELDRGSIETGLEALFAPSLEHCRSSHYFKPVELDSPQDVGPDLDPVDLGLVSMEEVCTLFPMYFMRLHPFNGILDPALHTPGFVRCRSSLLFTWILALTAQFEHRFTALSTRLQCHGEKLSRHVLSCGYKSVEIVQGYYISLLCATPAKTLAEERSWLYTMYAMGVAAELGLDQASKTAYSPSTPTNITGAPFSGAVTGTQEFSCLRSTTNRDLNTSARNEGDVPPADTNYTERLVRNRERTWLRILLWERANSAARGRTGPFPDTELTFNIENWWLHPLADLTDKYTCAFILLRRNLAALYSELRRQRNMAHASRHWVRDLINGSFDIWQKTWLPGFDTIESESERLPNRYLYYVYTHNRLWTLSFALHFLTAEREIHAVREDCFVAAIHCCETAVRDLQTIGEPLYCMQAPTWAMISYASILALKLFPWLHGSRPGYEVELLGLLSQVALQLKRAGSTPEQRFGIAALLGEHLLMILRSRATALRESVDISDIQPVIPYPNALPETQIHDLLGSTYNPTLPIGTMSAEPDFAGDGFADLFREIFGPGLGDIYLNK